MVADAVEVFGVGNFALILKNYPFDGRTEAQMEDMWKLVQISKIGEEKEEWEWQQWYWDPDWEWDGLVLAADGNKDDWPVTKSHGPKPYILSHTKPHNLQHSVSITRLVY